MFYVYLLRSSSDPAQTYIGLTKDLKARFSAHNRGESKHTAKSLPWKIISYHAFEDKERAQQFEYYLKTGSGQAFAKRHLW